VAYSCVVLVVSFGFRSGHPSCVCLTFLCLLDCRYVSSPKHSAVQFYDINSYILCLKLFQVKEEESGTLEIVQAIQSTTLTLQKAKDAYKIGRAHV
jgi:hypothetical protein